MRRLLGWECFLRLPNSSFKNYKMKKILMLFGILMPILNIPGQDPLIHQDYSQTLVMKLHMSILEENWGSKVFCDFENALYLIKKADGPTLQIPNIYLVGWQYNGHDDKYPAFFKVSVRDHAIRLILKAGQPYLLKPLTKN